MRAVGGETKADRLRDTRHHSKTAAAGCDQLSRLYSLSAIALSWRPHPSLDASMSFGGRVHDILGPVAIQRGDDAAYRVASDGLDERIGPAQAMGGWDHGLHGQKRVVGV